MGQIHFLFGVHNHQPVGNFDEVFEDAYRKAYLPFLELLARHPRIKINLHNSGCLWEWLEIHHPEYFHLVQTLVDWNQVELLSGPFYEAILPAIPERDRQGQIRMLTDYLRNHFGVYPCGSWLPERVWEPELAGTFADAGITHTLTDDWHFRAVGFEEKTLNGYYLTEDRGKIVAIFPISQNMRYSVPFRPVEESADYLVQSAVEEGHSAVILADDGEKFGVWPGTHRHCYEEGWLERFFQTLENIKCLRMGTLSEYLKKVTPKGRAYLPTTSYAEMMEWALPAKAQQDYQEFLEKVKFEPYYERYCPFIKGGYWRNYLTKYPEANHLHKRMFRVSERIQEEADQSGDPLWVQARKCLYRAQCNCAYWHGIFGGLYLPHLRAAVYSCILQAESYLDKLSPTRFRTNLEEIDFDACGQKEIIIETPKQNLYLSPSQGGALMEWDTKSDRRNLCDVLARREEGYHRKLRSMTEDESNKPAQSIHEQVIAKEVGLEKYLIYDHRVRHSLIDRFFLSGSLEEERNARLREVGWGLNKSYQFRSESNTQRARVTFWLDDGLAMPYGKHCIRLEKSIIAYKNSVRFEVLHTLTNLGDLPLKVYFGLEFNFGLLSGDSPERFYEFQNVHVEDRSMMSEGELEGLSGINLVDTWAGFRVALSWNVPAKVWRYPVQTVSLSESGFERLYQCSSFLPHWNLEILSREVWESRLEARVEKL